MSDVPQNTPSTGTLNRTEDPDHQAEDEGAGHAGVLHDRRAQGDERPRDERNQHRQTDATSAEHTSGATRACR
jgi:hypothetical protein